MVRAHVPQIPSRQSESNAIGSSLLAINPSLTTSSISRNEVFGETFVAWYSTSLPFVFGSFCRQTLSLKFICSFSASAGRFQTATARDAASARRQNRFLDIPTQKHRRNFRRRVMLRRPASDVLPGNDRRMIHRG